MQYQSFNNHIKKIEFGKQTTDAIYLHESLIIYLPEELISFISRISKTLKIEKNQWNVVKLYKRDFKFSLLSYPSFDIDSYPPLNNSYTVDLTKLTCRKADYTATDNPPILHRKELFVPEDYPLISEFRDITNEGETIGLYENPRNIGFKKNWHKIIKQKGYILNKNGRLEKLIKAEGKQ